MKWCENRSWRFPADLLGTSLLIHASSTKGNLGDHLFYDVPQDIPRGAIVGYVTVIGCLPSSRDRHSEGVAIAAYEQLAHITPTTDKASLCHVDDSGWWWLLAKPVMLKEPIPCSGKLRIWHYDGKPAVTMEARRMYYEASLNSRTA